MLATTPHAIARAIQDRARTAREAHVGLAAMLRIVLTLDREVLHILVITKPAAARARYF
jgi:hypothetical protein